MYIAGVKDASIFSCTKRLCVETKMAFSIWSILPTICKFSLSAAKKIPFGENLLTVSFSKYSRKAKRFHAKNNHFATVWSSLAVYSESFRSTFLGLKGQCHKFFASGFFLESVSPKPLIIPSGPFRNFSKIRGDIRSSRFANGVNDTGGNWKKPSSRKILIILFGHLWVVELTYI
jgi:hypothetical protein